MLHPLLRRLLLTGIPALLVASVAFSTIWGEHGLLRHLQLERELAHANAHLAAVERHNQRLELEIHQMDEDPVVIERIAADELTWAEPGSILYRFDDASIPDDEAPPAH